MITGLYRTSKSISFQMELLRVILLWGSVVLIHSKYIYIIQNGYCIKYLTELSSSTITL